MKKEKRNYLKEGCWVYWVDSDGKIKFGEIVRKWEKKPFSSINWWVRDKWGYSSINLSEILYIFPGARYDPIDILIGKLEGENAE